jgi:catechol 2,3-dioxygenase-like lactoylglutathione lyase family enzyme
MIAITHVGLAVPDIKKAIDWYINVLDFRLIAGIEMALSRPEMRGQMLAYLEGLREKNSVSVTEPSSKKDV